MADQTDPADSPRPGKSPDIFLSYGREDLPKARLFAAALEREGFKVWWDATLQTGESFDEVIEKTLNEAKAVVVLWSEQSVRSRWVRAEATIADRNKTLAPVMIEPCMRPIMFELTHAADLSHWTGDAKDEAWQTFIADLRRFVERGAPLGPTLPGDRSPRSGSPAISRARSRSLLIATPILAIVIGALLAYLFVHTRRQVPQSAAATVVPAAAPHQTELEKTAARAQSSPADSEPSIAVLPFVNMSNDHDQDYFSDGLTEELLNQLAQVPNLRVVGRTSSFAFKGKYEDLRAIGETLGVNHILEGSVRKSGDRLRITAQLINPADGSHIWSANYDRNLGDVFAIQEDIARTVASALSLSIGLMDLSQGGTRNLQAHDAYLRAMSGADPLAAAAYMERAVELDPHFANAWAQLASLYGGPLLLFVPDRAAEWQRKAAQAAQHLLTLAPNSPAAKLLIAARELDAGHLNQCELLLMSLQNRGTSSFDVYAAYGAFLIEVGKPSKALEEFSRAIEFDPLGQFPTIGRQISYEMVGDYARAEAEAGRWQALNPGDADSVGAGTDILRAMGRRDLGALKTLLAAKPTENQAGTDRINNAMLPFLERPPEALAKLRRIYEDPEFPLQPLTMTVVAQWAAYFNDPKFSLQVLRKMAASGMPRNSWMLSLWRPVEKDVRRLPAFKELLRESGLVEYWRTSGEWGEFCQPVSKDDFECH